MNIRRLGLTLLVGLLATTLGGQCAVAAVAGEAGDDAANLAPAISPSPSDAAVEAAAPAPPAADGAEGAPPALRPWTMPQPCFLSRLGINASGWIEQGLTFNSLSPTDRWNGPLVTNDRSNEYELNQAWLALARPVKTGDGFDIGGRIDLMYGSDWRYGECLGLETNLDNPNKLYGFILPQFYVEAAYNDLTVKMGHYAASMGYEVVAAPGNFFYSHSYELAYAEVILVTGVQAEYKLTNNWSVNGGFNRGWEMFEDNNEKMDFLGGLKWHNDQNTTSLSFEIDVGPQDPLGIDNRYDYALVFKQQLSKDLLYVAQHNMGGQPQTGLTPAGGYANWYGLAQYLIYTINPTWSVGTRIEWFRDDDGARVAGIGNVNYGWPGQPGFRGTFTEWTTGLNWRPCLNCVIRPEIRCDWYSGTPNSQDQLPFGDGRHSEQLTFATDMIVTF